MTTSMRAIAAVPPDRAVIKRFAVSEPPRCGVRGGPDGRDDDIVIIGTLDVRGRVQS
jgi:hypothetical protein